MSFAKLNFRQLLQNSFRFPIALASVILAAITSITIYHIDWEFDDPIVFFLSKIVFLCWLSFPLFVALQLYRERQQLANWKFALLVSLSFLFLILFFFHLPADMEDMSLSYGLQMVAVSIAFVFLVPVAPFALTKENQGLWQFTWILAWRAFVSSFFAGVIFVGIMLALLGLRLLLKVELPEYLYMDIFMLSGGVFAPWFFLGGIPRAFAKLEADGVDYSRLMSIFTNFILLPLSAVYLVILYIYGLQLIITQSWPEGQVVYIVTSFIIPAIITAKLLFPLRNKPWVTKVTKGLYLSILPLMYLYFSAVWFRVEEFGLTERRYLVVLFGLWVVGICLYYLISKQKLLKVLPISVAAVVILASFGPWSMFNLSKIWQTQALAQVLEENQILVNGKIQKAPEGEVSSKEAAIITEKVEYLNDNHGPETLRSWYTDEQWEAVELSRYEYSLLEPMGVKYTGLEPDFEDYDDNNFSFYSCDNSAFSAFDPLSSNLDGYNQLSTISYSKYASKNTLKGTTTGSPNYLLYSWDDDQNIIVEDLDGRDLVVDFSEFTEDLAKNNLSSCLQPKNNYFTVENENFRAKVLLRTVSFDRESVGVIELSRVSGILLVGIKD